MLTITAALLFALSPTWATPGVALRATAPSLGARTNTTLADAPGSAAQKLAKTSTPLNAVSQLTDLLVEQQYLALEDLLNASPNIPPVQRAFFEGVLANRENRIADSSTDLELALKDQTHALAPVEETIALRTLADNYIKSFRYGDAADTYARLLRRPDSLLPQAERNDLDGTRRLMELLQSVPAQTVSVSGAFMISTKKNAIGLAEIPVTIGGRQESWILDTGANLSLVTSSEAQELGLTISQGTAPMSGLGGGHASAHAAVIPELKVGTATFRHVAVLVVDDKDFYIAGAKFQVRAILGYPALSALGSITLYDDGRFGAGPAPTGGKNPGSQMLMEELAPLVAVTIQDTQRLFLLDTGTASTYLTERYWRDHRGEFAGQETHKVTISGAGGSQELPAYTAKNVAMSVGGVHLTLQSVSVLGRSAGISADYFYGTLGQNVLRMFSSCTLDFDSMRYTCVRDASKANQSDADKDDDD